MHKANSDEHKETSQDLQLRAIMDSNPEVAELYQDTIYLQREDKEKDFIKLSKI